MGTLTPDRLLPAPGQVSLVHTPARPDLPSPTTPCASTLAMLPAPGGLGHRFALPAIGGSSDFAHCSQARQSHQAVSSSCRGPLWASLFYGRSVHFQLLSTSRHRDAVTFRCLAGSSAREGLAPSCAGALPSARAATARRRQTPSSLASAGDQTSPLRASGLHELALPRVRAGAAVLILPCLGPPASLPAWRGLIESRDSAGHATGAPGKMRIAGAGDLVVALLSRYCAVCGIHDDDPSTHPSPHPMGRGCPACLP